MDKMLRASNICTDILCLKNYLIALVNVENLTDETKQSIFYILKKINQFYNQYETYNTVYLAKVIKDLTTIRELITKLHIRRYKNKILQKQYDDICFYLSELKNIYYSDFAV